MSASLQKILILLTHSDLGGAERVALDFIKNVHQRRYDCHVVLPRSGALEGELRSAGVPWTILPFGGRMTRLTQTGKRRLNLATLTALALDLWRYLAGLRRLAVATRPDIVYTHGVKAEFLSAALSLIYRVPIVWHLHVFSPQGLAGRVHRILAGRVRTLIANSAAVRNALYPECQAKCRVVHCGIDTDHFRPLARPSNSQNAATPADGIMIGMVCVLAPWKGVDLFLRAVAPVMIANDAVRAMVVGDVLYDTEGHSSHYKDELVQLAQQLGIGARVVFHPFMKDPLPAFSALDIAVHASKTPEPFGRVVAEAMSCGKAVIASAGGGVLEQIQPGVDGLLTKMNDESSLRAALDTLVNDPALRQQLGRAARQRVVTNLSLSQFVERVSDALQQTTRAPDVSETPKAA